MIADAISFLMRQLMWIYQIIVLAIFPVLLLCACWALLNWSDPGLVTLKSLLPKADAASLQPPP